MKKYILFLFIFVFGLGLFSMSAHPAKASDTSCVISVTLRVGSSGTQVACLQSSLGGLVADGRFGPRTKAAVVLFQRNNGLVADGIFGPRSRALWVSKGWGNPQSSVVISGVSGPQALNVNQAGTWTVTASEKNGGTLSYFVVWGDEAQPAPMTSPSNSPMQQSATFTHSYSSSGTYTPRFIVTNNIVCVAYPCPNSSASTSLSVNVGGVATNQYITTTSLPSGTIGVAYSATVSATGGTGNYDWKVSSGSLPAGLSLYTAQCYAYPCQAPATISGTPTTAGSSTFTVTLTLASGVYASKTFTININSATAISSLSPTSGVVGSQVTISGNYFTPTGNKIKFGDTNSENDPSYNLNIQYHGCPAGYQCSDPGVITFTVPSTYYVACLHSTPSCEVATRMVLPGTYPVSVINANGTSNAVNFTVTQ